MSPAAKRRVHWLLAVGLVGVLPVVLLCIGEARFILHHFYVRAPYLQDSGSNSAIIYHAGLIPHNPRIACDYSDSYFGIHFSPLVSAFSLLSYVFPIGRIEWYAVFQALVYLPIALATWVIASRVDGALGPKRLAFTAMAAVAFSLNGQVLWSIGYPHLEPAIPGLVCMTLGAVATGRTRLAWTCLVLAATVREDAGLHTALALTPLAYLHARGCAMLTSGRTVWRMIGVALAASITAFVVQRLAFHSANLLSSEYFGDPFYAHLSGSLLADRARAFLDGRQVFYYPFLATLLVALLRRDPRYLLGWAAAVPWFAMNFMAKQEEKGLLSLYTGFPFLVSVFWVYLYGTLLAPVNRRLDLGVVAVLFAVIASSSTLGFYRAGSNSLVFIAKDMAYHRPMDRRAVHDFVDYLVADRSRLGRLYIDSAVAALAIDSFSLETVWHKGSTADAIAFHSETWAQADSMTTDLVTNALDTCIHALHTSLYLCVRDPASLGTADASVMEQVPAMFVFARYDHRHAHVGRGGLEIARDTEVGVPVGQLAAGTYQLGLEAQAGTVRTDDAAVQIALSGDGEPLDVTRSFSGQMLVVTFTTPGGRFLLLHIRNISNDSLTFTNAKVVR